MKEIQTVSVPYIPNFGEDVPKPEYFDKIKDFESLGVDKSEFELHEIQGTRMVYLADRQEWVDLGHQAIYRRKGK